MTLNNAVNSPFPTSATNGGTGVSEPTIHGIMIAQGSLPMTPIVLTDGQVLVGTTALDPVGTTISGSGNVIVNSSSGTIAISLIGYASFSWTNVTGTSASLAVNNGYISNNASLVTLTLPVTASQGTLISICGNGAGGWRIAQNASQNIKFGNQTTITGTGGSLTSTNQYDNIDILCTVANTTWVVRSSIGNITIV